MKTKNNITTIFLFLIFSSLLVSFSLWGNEDYKISVITDSQAGEKKAQAVLLTFDPITQAKKVVAETAIETGKPAQLAFKFKYPDLFRLEVKGQRPLYLVIDKDQKNVTVTLKKDKNVKITGSPDSQKNTSV